MSAPSVHWLWLLLVALSSHAALPERHFSLPQEFAVGDMTADAAGNIYVCGTAPNPRSLNTNLVSLGRRASSSALCVLKLSRAGAILSGAVVNQLSNTQPARITTDKAGNVLVAGNMLLDINTSALFVARFDSACRNLLGSSFVRSAGKSFVEVEAVTTDAAGNAFIGGMTYNELESATRIGAPTQDPEAFVAKIAADGAVAFVTTFGGSDRTLPSFGGAGIQALAVSDRGELYAAGWTQSVDFPGITPGSLAVNQGDLQGTDGFLVKIAPDGKSLLSSFVVGGEREDIIYALAVDKQGNAYLGGTTSSTEWPGAAPSGALGSDETIFRGFITKVDTSGTNIVTSQLLAPTGLDQITAMTFDSNGIISAAGIAGKWRDWYGLGYPVPYSQRTASSQAFVAVGDPERSILTSVVDRGCGEPTDRYDDVRLGPSGILYVLSRPFQSPDTTIRAIAPATITAKSETPRLLLRQPASGYIAGTNSLVSLQAVISGAAVEAVTGPVRFFDGRRLIATASNAPCELIVTNWARGVHWLSAETIINGRTVRSCRVPMRVRTIANDSFSHATVMKGERFVIQGTLSGATAEPFDRRKWFGAYAYTNTVSDPDVWYSWTAPRTGLFGFTVESPAWHHVEIYSGSALTNLQVATETSPYDTEATLHATNGVTYHIRLSNAYQRTGRYKLSLRPVTPPPNDDWNNATAIAGEQLSVSANMRNASIDAGTSYFKSIWFLWTAPAKASYIANVNDPAGGTGVAVYKGTSIENFVNHGSTLSGALLPGVAFQANAGEQLYIALSTWYEASNVVLQIQQPTAPANDHFTGRILLSGESVTTNGSTVGATIEPGEIGDLDSAASIWWSWTAPSSRLYSILVSRGATSYSSPLDRPVLHSPSDPNQTGWPLTVYTGDALASLQTIAKSDDIFGPEAILNAQAGITYHLRVAAPGLADFGLTISPITRPENDNFADAIALYGQAGVRGTLRAATLETNEPLHEVLFQTPDSSVWYTWTAPSNGLFAFEVTGYALMDVYIGGSVDSLRSLAGAQSRFVFRAEPGVPYAIAIVPSLGGILLHFTLRTTWVTPAANDNFPNREIVDGIDAQMSADARNATPDAGEPGISRSLWWSWTAPTNGTFALEASDYLNVSVSVGNAVSELQQVSSSSQGALTFQATAGRTYVLRADFSAAYTDAADLHLYLVDPPSNDDFANATSIRSAEFAVNGSNAGATVEPGEPNHGYSSATRSLWWAWTPPADELILVTARGANGGARLGIYTGTALTNLQSIRSASESTVIQVQSNATYYIAVDQPWSFGALTLEGRRTQRAPNDRFSARVPIGTGVVTGSFAGATTEPAESNLRAGTNGGSVWFTFRSVSRGAFMLETVSSSGHSLPLSFPVDVFTGDKLETLVPTETKLFSARELLRIA